MMCCLQIQTRYNISMIFPGFFSKFPGIFFHNLKYDFQINMQTYSVSFEQKIDHFNYTPN